MPIFRCEQCGCVENTAASGYWSRKDEKDTRALCTQCDPTIRKWHGMFKRMSAKGFVLCSDGFLCSKDEIETDSFKFRQKHQGLKVVKEITEDGVL